MKKQLKKRKIRFESKFSFVDNWENGANDRKKPKF